MVFIRIILLPMNGSNIKNVLITGATGFVGSHLTKRLVDDGFNVSIIHLQSTSLPLSEFYKSKVKHFLYDGSSENVLNIFKNSNPECVFHLASLVLSEHRLQNITPLISSNVLFGCQLLEAMKLIGCNKFINTGSYWQHYNNETYNPVNLYAATKQAFEDLIKYYTEAANIRAVTLKLFDTYGPNDQRGKLLNLLENAGHSGKTIDLTPGEQLINLLYIDDVIDAYLATLKLFNLSDFRYETFGVGNENPIRLREFVEMYKKITGLNIKINWGGKRYRSREILIPWTNWNALPEWRPKIDLEMGIKKLQKS